MKQKKETDLGREPIGRLLFRLSVPAITAQVVNVLYNMVDRVYIGHIPGYGAQALTGVGVTFPLIMLISAFATREMVMNAYQQAIAEEYRFFSFGDSMLLY